MGFLVYCGVAMQLQNGLLDASSHGYRYADVHAEQTQNVVCCTIVEHLYLFYQCQCLHMINLQIREFAPLVKASFGKVLIPTGVLKSFSSGNLHLSVTSMRRVAGTRQFLLDGLRLVVLLAAF